MNTLLAAVETQFAARLASEQRMRQFLADASHELRTPLTSIRGYAELARMQRQSGRPRAADNLRRIESEGTRMSRLVEDLLVLARGDQGEPCAARAGRRWTRCSPSGRPGRARPTRERQSRCRPRPTWPWWATATSCCGW